MKKKSSARSAMSELLSKQSTGGSAEASSAARKNGGSDRRRGFIETLDSGVSKRTAPVSAAEKYMRANDRKTARPSDRPECGSAPAPRTAPRKAAPRPQAAPSAPIPRPAAQRKRKQARKAIRFSVPKLSAAAKMTAAVILFVCLCTGVISAVLLKDDKNAPISDASVGYTANSDGAAADVVGEPAAAAPDEEQNAEKSEPEDSASDSGLYRVSFTFYKKDSVSCYTKSRTVGEIVELMGIELDENEKARTDLTATVNADTDINVDCVEYGTDTATSPVEYETRYVDIQTIPRGSTKVYQQGRAGTKTTEYKVTYLNGVECEREVSNEYISTAPTECVIYRGVGGSVSAGGKTYTYSYYIDCASTVYTGGGTTASGLPASENVIAVDPRVIPLGTRVYIDGVGFRTAADTGGSIKGNFIDIYYNSGNPALAGYGRRSVRVYIF